MKPWDIKASRFSLSEFKKRADALRFFNPKIKNTVFDRLAEIEEEKIALLTRVESFNKHMKKEKKNFAKGRPARIPLPTL